MDTSDSVKQINIDSSAIENKNMEEAENIELNTNEEMNVEPVKTNNNTSLGLLAAAYGTYSDSESDNDDNNTENKDEETSMVVDQIQKTPNSEELLKPTVPLNADSTTKEITTTSNLDSEDSETDSDSGDSSNGDEPPIPNTVPITDIEKVVDGPYREASSSDEENSFSDSDVEEISHADLDEFLNTNKDKSSKTKNMNKQTTGEDGIESLPPIEDLKITVTEDECVELGKITSIVEQLVLVDSLPGTVPLNLDSVLFLDKGNKALGKVFDVIGNVASPMYCVRFNSNEEIKMKNIEINSIVYVAPRTEHTNFVCISDLMKEKKTDASKENDIECSSESDYSDDETERQKKSIKLGKNKSRGDNIHNVDANKYMRGTYRSPRGNRNNPRVFQRPPRGQYGQSYGNQRPNRSQQHQQQQQQQHHHHHQQQPDNYYYSWHSNYQYQQHQHQSMQQQMRPLLFPNPYAMPPPQPYTAPYIPSNLMQQPLFPPPTQQITKQERENR